MRHSILTLLIAAIGTFALYAQEGEGSKILVFRNTGEITIFNSDSITKVELSVFDADSIAHAEFVSQVFHQNNSKIDVIPLAEIDSVAFGYRNIIEPKKGVRCLTDEEAEAISSFDGETILYDSRLSLKEGETVYYDCITDILPIGLCVRVDNVSGQADNLRAAVTMLDAADVFDRYLVTGDSSLSGSSSLKKAQDYDSQPFEFELPEINHNGMRIEGKLQLNFDAEATDIVVDTKNKYYHASVKLFAYPRMEFTVLTSEKQEIHNEYPQEGKPHITIPVLARIINFSAIFDWFFDAMAEAGVQYEFGQEYAVTFEWTRKDGENTFTNPVITPTDPAATTQKFEVHLNGEVFTGPRVDFQICTIFELAGAGIELKIGPRLQSEFSMGLIQEMSRNFNQENYAKANIEFQFGLKAETYYFHRLLSNPLVRNKVKLPFESEIFAYLFTHNFFPEFNSRAVLGRATAPIVQTGEEPEAVSISTFAEDELPYPLDISFEIADRNTDDTLAETEVIETLEKEKDDYQTVYSDITLPSSLKNVNMDDIVARPVINYKGYKVKAAPTNIAEGMVMSPVICTLNENSTYFVSGVTPVSQHTFGEETYIEGNIVGVFKGDPRYKKRKFKIYEFIDLSDPENCKGSEMTYCSLYGVWTGTIAGEEVTFTFSDNGCGTYNGVEFTYEVNSPQLGGIAIQLENGGTISFSIIDISDTSLTILMKGSEEEVILQRR